MTADALADAHIFTQIRSSPINTTSTCSSDACKCRVASRLFSSRYQRTTFLLGIHSLYDHLCRCLIYLQHKRWPNKCSEAISNLRTSNLTHIVTKRTPYTQNHIACYSLLQKLWPPSSYGRHDLVQRPAWPFEEYPWMAPLLPINHLSQKSGNRWLLTT